MPGALIDRQSIILEIRKAHAIQLTEARRSGDSPSDVTSHHDVWLKFAEYDVFFADVEAK